MFKVHSSEIIRMANRFHTRCCDITTISALVTFIVTKPWILGSVGWLDNLVDLVTLSLAIIYVSGISVRKYIFTPAVLSLSSFIVYNLVIVFIKTPSMLVSEISLWLRALVGFGFSYELIRLDQPKALDGMGKCSSALLVIDFITGLICIFSGSENYKIFSILGTDVYSIFSIVPLLAMVVVDANINGGKKKGIAVVLLLACTLQKLITGAATAEVALLVVVALLLLVKFRPRIARLVLNPINGFALLVICTIIFAVFRATEAFTPLFEMLGKDPTMTGRTIIWEAAVPEIFNCLIFGHGTLELIEFVSLMGFNPWDLYWGHCHNMILELLFRDGIVGLILMSIFIFCVFRHYRVNNCAIDSANGHSDALMIILAFLFVSCILWITDGYTSVSSIFMMFGIYMGLAGFTGPVDVLTPFKERR